MTTQGMPSMDPRPTGLTIGTYDTYREAQRAVDYLSDEKFPVEHTTIVGTDLRLVEKVLGRVTVLRAALLGAGTGAWFGLLIGLVLGIFASSGWFLILLTGLVLGAVWGAVFGAIAQAATRGQRDFASRSMLVAGQYALNVDAEYADQARQLLTRLNWRTSESS
jgi:ascorbate-specific PTS system EIIC-type component UlaA